ncbi:unnamed protein product [Mesocestoides corti]|uniref:rRNA biogenesis protein RRP36 n=1 Tax=Mesocestoides corti TaxID=53468 RepID=A0A0R3UJH9_MESCO|nr:unnamed protein product [Mesocestoides corti]
MAASSVCSSDDDEPVSVSFKQLKKDKFVLSKHLKRDYEHAKKQLIRKNQFRDPRFDPRVNGLCVLSDWTSLKEEQENTMQILKKQLKKVRSEEQREKVTKAIQLLRQRRATQMDVELKRRVKRDLQRQQMDALRAGKRASFITRNKLRDKVKEERLKLLTKRGKEKYLSRQSRKKSGANVFDDYNE